MADLRSSLSSLPLDSLLPNRRQNNGRTSGGGRNKSSNKGSGGRGGNGGGGSGVDAPSWRQGHNSKPYSRPSQGAASTSPKTAVYAPAADSAADGMWTHDKFEDGKAPAAGEQPVPVETTVRLSNLHWDVSTDDLHELFGHKFGILKSANLKYDAAGRSECIADLVFVTRESALNAVELYNGRELDGLPMLLKLVESVSNRLGPAGKTAGRSSRTPDQRDGRGQARLASAPVPPAPAQASKKPVDDMDVDMDAPVRSGGSNSNNSRDRTRRPNSHGAAASGNGKAAQSGNSSGNNSNKKLDDRLGKTLDARLGKTLDDRLGKSLEERLGRKLEDRLGPLSIGPLGSDGDWRSAQRGSRTSGNNRGRQQRDSGVTQMLLDAQMDAYKSTASGRKNPRQIVSYAGTQVPMDGNMI